MSIYHVIRTSLKSDLLKEELKNEETTGWKEVKNEGLKYSEIHEILKDYDENYTKRELTYYIEKGLIPKPKKTAPNQAEYSLKHIVYFLIIKEMKGYIDREDINSHLDLIKNGESLIEFDELFSLYATNDFIDEVINSILEQVIEKLDYDEIENSFIEDLKVEEIEIEDKELIQKLIKSIIYFSLGKYFMDKFKDEIIK